MCCSSWWWPIWKTETCSSYYTQWRYRCARWRKIGIFLEMQRHCGMIFLLRLPKSSLSKAATRQKAKENNRINSHAQDATEFQRNVLTGVCWLLVLCSHGLASTKAVTAKDMTVFVTRKQYLQVKGMWQVNVDKLHMEMRTIEVCHSGSVSRNKVLQNGSPDL